MTRTIAVALDGAGWHPAAWRESDARPRELFTARYWLDLVRTAEKGGVDFVTIEDSLGLQSAAFARPDDRIDQVRGRLDALLIASFVAPLTSRIGLIPTVTTTHTEPFHVATALQTLDFASLGRAGWRPQVSGSATDASLIGRRSFPPLTIDQLSTAEGIALQESLFGEAREAIEVVRRLWDSWEDDAIIRDASTGRFIDRDKLHYADFEGEYFSVKGTSITPRSPQGQPLVTVLAHQRIPYELAATSADIVYVTPRTDAAATFIRDEVRDAEARVGRAGRPLSLYADLVVLLEDSPAAARSALDRLDEQNGTPLASDALIFAGTPDGLIDQLDAWTALGYDGFRLRPARLPHDLVAITEKVLPRLGREDAAASDGRTLRERLGFGRAENRHASTPASSTSATSTRETAA
ncbi:LLM class flavin-dependent oxidoreductase [Leifsonia flava]|uniref:LLM class flavin-dependent oxidoreductase n=1 Tax=Orlajensenia leifsoniae TaxID=2561933 RepID=A0A4Y9R230_9MICO|nr:LLM class flavin-dependent oxidoreductase [Leifsonia flava]TFV98052.1 LLM class flavin-dependent oxidoreductase [Leifsonia flava]